jgi:hypothetical protein
LPDRLASRSQEIVNGWARKGSHGVHNARRTMTVLHQHCGAARSMFANRLRPIDQLPLAHCRRPQRASNAIQPLFLLVLGQEMSAAQRRKGISREAVNCA